ncbi:MAG: hypothetical protein HRT99_04170 [Mycoplasmatales bacterium]|nr:hypothetical protein [Mycoplasmatales bacterium]NQZ66377.1 hypothetical protein [Mycoplasmatales bacterium]
MQKNQEITRHEINDLKDILYKLENTSIETLNKLTNLTAEDYENAIKINKHLDFI